jgi:hypothetical protein
MFETISNDKAYFLGFFSADGCNEKRTLSIQLQKRDCYILESFNNLFKSEGYSTNLNEESRKITLSNGTEATYSRLRIYGTELCNEVTQLGFPPNKTYSIILPHIPDEYMPDYIRGLIDGDGCISVRRKNIEVEIYSASESYLQSILDWVHKNTNISPKTVQKKRNIYRLQFYGNESLELCKLIYSSNSDLYLRRKKDLVDNFSFERSPRYWTKEQIQYLKDNYRPNEKGLLLQLSNDLHKSYKSVSKQIWTLGLSKNNG